MVSKTQLGKIKVREARQCGAPNRGDNFSPCFHWPASRASSPRPAARAGEGPLETTTVRLGYIPAACDAPVHAAADLLHGEGFTDVRFITAAPGRARIDALGRGEFDFTMSLPSHKSAPWTPIFRSPSSPACTPAALSCSPVRAFAGSPISKASALAWR